MKTLILQFCQDDLCHKTRFKTKNSKRNVYPEYFDEDDVVYKKQEEIVLDDDTLKIVYKKIKATTVINFMVDYGYDRVNFEKSKISF